MTTTRWVWQAPHWPTFIHDSARVCGALGPARLEQGRLLGKASAVGASQLLSVQQEVWSAEAVATAAIEGERLDLDAVRSSVARRLGIQPGFVAAVPRHVDGLLDVMEDAAARWDQDLDEARLCRWQSALFPGGVSSIHAIATGRYRTGEEPMQIVSGPAHRPKVHFEAPPAAQVPGEMVRLVDWFNRSRLDPVLDGVVRAAIVHLWFETIHPFEDGNGRVGRALVDMALAQAARTPYRLHGLSTALRRRQAAYHAALNEAQRGDGDATAWLVWFIDTFRAACAESSRLIDEALVRARFWADHAGVELNERQRKAVNRMLEAGPGRFEGGMTTRKYVTLTRAGTSVTAARDLADLVEKGLLRREGAGRSTYYDLALPGWEWVPPIAAGKASAE